jgi:hypothetical protein
MSLRDLAETDLGGILEDNAYGFGYPIRLTDPDKKSADLIGFSNDIAFLIDPDTGTAISGRTASAALRISSITAEGFTSLPDEVKNKLLKPWLIEFTDINSNSFKFKVRRGHPDRALGVIVCELELYAD